jgi:hypothetical protein
MAYCLYHIFAICVSQSPCASNVAEYRRLWRNLLGAFRLSLSGLGHRLLLHLEVGQGHREGRLLHRHLPLRSPHRVLGKYFFV